MNSDILKTFIEVAKTRHFGHAAENLFLTQSAVSSRIKQLEISIGTKLFGRQRNNILLTEAGKRLLPHAENLLAGWQLALQETGVPTEQNLQISIGGTPNLWSAFLQSLLPRIARKLPNLYIRTEINTSQYLIRSLLGNRIDIFASIDTPTNSSISSRAIGELELIMVCNTPNKSITDLAEIGQVFIDWGTACNLEQARLFHEPVAPILHTEQAQIALEFILSYRGAAFFPRSLVQPYFDSNSLFQIKESLAIKKSVHVIYRKGEEKSNSLIGILNMLKEHDIKPEAALTTLPLKNDTTDWKSM